MHLIYKITSPSGKIYVGYTNDLRSRKKTHKHGRVKYPHLPLQKAFKKYGFDNFIWEIIESGLSQKEAQIREKHWIKTLNCLDSKIGYNASVGGIGFAGTEEIKKKISNTLKNKYHKKSGTRLKHSRERGGKSVKVFKALIIKKARGFESKRPAEVIKGEFIGEFDTQVECCEKLNLQKSKVCLCLKQEYGRRTHKGYLFEYAG